MSVVVVVMVIKWVVRTWFWRWISLVTVVVKWVVGRWLVVTWFWRWIPVVVLKWFGGDVAGDGLVLTVDVDGGG